MITEVEDFYEFESKFYDNLYSSFIDDLIFIKKYGFEPPYCELFSGTGRISRFLENSCGLEINKKMVLGASTRYNAVIGDARMIPFKKHFKTVLIPLNSLNLLDRNSRIEVLRESNRILLDNGKIYLEIMNGFPFEIENEFLVSEFSDHRNNVSVFITPISEGERLYFKYRYIINGETVTKKLMIFPISSKEIEEEAKLANLKILHIFGGFNFEEFNAKSDRMIIVMTK
jgi:hypothetical protein